MMFSKRAMVFLAAILFVTAAAAAPQEQRHEVLENKDLTDLLDADLDEPFRHAPRRLQEEEEAGTDAPTSAPTPSPGGLDGERGFETMAPTAADRDLLFTDAPVTSGASSWRSSASVASALVFVGSVAVAAVVA